MLLSCEKFLVPKYVTDVKKDNIWQVYGQLAFYEATK